MLILIMLLSQGQFSEEFLFRYHGTAEGEVFCVFVCFTYFISISFTLFILVFRSVLEC
jgi:hypothetical protein